jgi:hypothetical protein
VRRRLTRELDCEHRAFSGPPAVRRDFSVVELHDVTSYCQPQAETAARAVRPFRLAVMVENEAITCAIKQPSGAPPRGSSRRDTFVQLSGCASSRFRQAMSCLSRGERRGDTSISGAVGNYLLVNTLIKSSSVNEYPRQFEDSSYHSGRAGNIRGCA